MPVQISKKRIATEILSIQKAFVISIALGLLASAICFFLFKPFKFDAEKYQTWEGPTYSAIGASYPSYITDGFFDYTDDNISWNPSYFKERYQERKEYLLWKMLRFGLYSTGLGFTLLILLRYAIVTQKWVLRNAKG